MPEKQSFSGEVRIKKARSMRAFLIWAIKLPPYYQRFSSAVGTAFAEWLPSVFNEAVFFSRQQDG
jgi:hypothetical protein